MADETNEILQRLTRLETKLDLMGTARDIANEAMFRTLENSKKISELEDSQRWLWRTVATTIIAGVLSLLFKI